MEPNPATAFHGNARNLFTNMLTDIVIFAFAFALVAAYMVVAIKTVNESEH